MQTKKRLKAPSLLTAVSCLALLASTAHSATGQVAQNVGYGAKLADGGRGVPLKPDQKAELALKINQPFTVVGLGDLLQFQPFAKSNDPNVQYLIDIIRNADVAVGDLENEMFDFDNFGHFGGNLGTKEVADDWALMGIDMVSRANNKDQRAPGVWEDFKQVERVGIVHTGVARSLPEARMARYFNTPKGLVGMVGMYSEGGTDQCCAGGAQYVYVTAPQLAQVKAMKASILARRNEVEVPVVMPEPDPAGLANLFGVSFKLGPKPAVAEVPAGRGGRGGLGGPLGPQDGVINSLHLTLYHGVTAAQMTQLRAIAGDKGSGDLKAFGTQFRVMDRPGEHSFDMDPKDWKEMLTQIRTGKQASDILVTNMHWHQNRYDFQAYSHDHFPADFEIKFAHDAIDQGVDVFMAQGVHTIKGVEIYQGKPIFYGTSNFVFQSAIMPQGKGKVPTVPGVPPRADNFARDPVESGPNEIIGEHETQGFWQLKANLESFLAYSHFENGKLSEVRIYPVDLGQTPRVGSQVGIPRRPTPEVAKKILDEVVEYSKPFGTKIEIENGVGVIRIGSIGTAGGAAPSRAALSP